jgi:peptidoglycan/LPS O-acetylase OafA/YrhL
MTVAPVPHPAATRRYAYIDALRGFAALWVFVLHVHGYWLDDVRPPKLSADGVLVRLIGFGGAGVDIFIVLSGFCLTLPLTRAGSAALAGIDVRGFFRRRAFRLLPAYYAALAAVVALELIPTIRPALVPRDLTGVDVLTHLTLTFPLWQSTLAAVNGSLWSIPLEATLYLGFPLLVWLASRRGIRAVVIVTVAVAALWAVITGSLSWPLAGGWLPQPDKYLPARWLEFALGMYAATQVRGIPHPRAATHAVWACALGLPAGLYGYAAGVEIVRTIGFGALGAGLLVLLQRLPERLFDAGPLAWLAGLGTISYSFYLLHQPVILLLSGWGHRLGLGLIPLFVVALATSGTLTVAVATAFYRWVERPFLVRGSMSAVVRGGRT